MKSFVPKMLVVCNRHKSHINSSYLATLYSGIPEFMRKRSMLIVAQTTQKFVGKLSLQAIATLPVIREISDSNLRGTQRGFLLNALKTLCRLSRVLSDLWKCRRRYKICTCSGVLGQFEVFSKLQGLQYYFPENFRCNFKFYECENCSDSSLHRIFESENFRFPFSNLIPRAFPLKMGGAGKGPGIDWSRVQPKYS